MISYLLFPYPRPPLVLKSADDALPFFFCVDAYSTVLIIHSAIVSFQYLGKYRGRALTGCRGQAAEEGKRSD